MNHRTKRLVVVVVTAAVVAAGAGASIAAAAGGDDPPLTGDALERASAAAVEHIGGGRVTEAEVGDNGSGYEVEVLLDNGRQVEVQLDEQFNVLGSGADEDGSGTDDDGSGDDGEE